MKEKSEKKAKIEWGSKYFFTVNHRELTALLMITHEITSKYAVDGFKSAVEVGAKGNLHSHVYVVFSRSVRKDTLISNFKKYGAEIDKVTTGTEQTVINYIGNHDKEVSKGCQVIGDYTTIYGDIQTTQGTRNDLSDTDKALWGIKDVIDSGATLKDVYDTFFPFMIKYGRSLRDYMEFRETQREDKATKRMYKSIEEERSKRIEIEAQQTKCEEEILAGQQELIDAERLLLEKIYIKTWQVQ